MAWADEFCYNYLVKCGDDIVRIQGFLHGLPFEMRTLVIVLRQDTLLAPLPQPYEHLCTFLLFNILAPTSTYVFINQSGLHLFSE